MRVGWAASHYQGLCCASRKYEPGGWGQVVEGRRSVPRAEASHPHGALRQLNSHVVDPRTNGRLSGRGSLLGQGGWKGWKLITETSMGGPESYLGIFRVNIKTN